MDQANYEQTLALKLEQFLELSRKNTDSKEVQANSKELSKFTKNPFFVMSAHKLLVSPHSFPSNRKDSEILLTSLLKDKFKFQFQNISANVEIHYKQLTQIAQALFQSGFATYTNIALALAYTYIHSLAQEQHPSLDAFLAHLVPTSEDKVQLYNYYFKTLEYIATQIDNTKFVIDDIQRDRAHQKLIALQLKVLLDLEKITNDAFETPKMNKENILNCFQAWITVHYSSQVLNQLPSHSLFKKVIENIEDEEYGEAAGNCLRSIIYQLKNEEGTQHIFQVLSSCSIQIMGLIDKYIGGVQYEKAEDFVRIVSDFARKSRKLFVQKYDRNIQSFLRKLINYLGDDLMNTYESVADVFEGIIKEISDQKAEGKPIIPDIYHIFDPLYDSLCHRCAMPLRLIKELDHTDQTKAHYISSLAEEIMRNRDFTELIFQNISDLLGKTQYLNFVIKKLGQLNSQDEKNFWSKLQVYLFSLKDSVRQYPQIDTGAQQILDSFAKILQNPEPVPICVKRSYFNVLRGFTTSKIKSNQFTYRIMCTAISQFHEPLLLKTTQKTFQKACQEYKHMAADIFTQFNQLLQTHPQRSYVIRGMLTLICNDQALMNQFLKPALKFLFIKFHNEPEKIKRKEYMQSLIQSLKAFQDSPFSKEKIYLIVQFLREHWAFIKQVLGSPQKVKDDEDSDVEKTVRILKVLMRTLEFHFAEFLQDMFTTVLSAFVKYPICSYVYLVQVTVTIFSANPSFNEYLRKLYSDFCDIAFSHMNKIQDISRFSYLLDDYMGMNKRFFLYNASTVLSSGKLPSIIELTINFFMGCDVPRVAKSAYSFFQTIFLVYWPAEHLHHRNQKEDITPFIPKPEDSQYYLALKQFLLQNLDQIITKMLQHLSNAPTEQTRDYILDALVSQIKAFVPENPLVWGNILNSIPSQILVQQQKERMMQMLESLKTSNFEASRKIIRSFDKMLVLINRRINNAQRRENIRI